MIWRALTLVLVGTCVALGAWMYLRDRGVYAPQHSELARAEFDAGAALDLVAPPDRCAGRCTAEVLGRTAPGQWRVRLTANTWRRCFVLKVNDFGYTEQHGLGGLRSVGCG